MAWGEGSEQPGSPQVNIPEESVCGCLEPEMDKSQELGLGSPALSPVSLCPVPGRAISFSGICH